MTTLTHHSAPPTPGMTRRQVLVLVLLLASQFMLAVDFSILNVALPSVGSGLGIAKADVQWIATTFALGAAGFTLLFGRVADFVGRRRLFLVGMTALGAASLLGGLAPSPGILLLARAAQGLATAAITPAALSLLTTTFAEGRLRDRALGLNSVMMSSGFTVGAVLGGVLTDLLSWRWAFLVNVPIAVVVVAVAPALLRDSAERERARLDLGGATLVTLGLVALVMGATRAGSVGVTDPLTLATLGLAAILLVAFWLLEERHPHPLVSTRVLRRRNVAWGNVAGLVTFAMESALVFLLTMYLQQVLGLDPLQTGLVLVAMGVGCVLGGVLAPRVIETVGVRRAAVGGLLTQALLTGTLVLVGETTASIVLVVAATFVGALGHVTAIVAFMVSATSGLPDREQGLATGLATMTQQVAMALGVPLLSAVAIAAGGVDSLAALRVAIGLDAAVVLAGALLVAAGLRPVVREAAQPTLMPANRSSSGTEVGTCEVTSS
ncbi:MFS transporter [Nocardioides sp. BP30]|uniref:MFS transporter n=1 Tax=Nocardioides sp. BP30 TaxID=3036374 RepID=UPI002468CA98|nr:MFS transporter [Nocardioides sp. BP30]WGL53378.1 MFS transporter [Nocardioides sp. BP30]